MVMIRYSKGKSYFSTILIIIGILVLLIIYWVLKPKLNISYEQTPIVACRSNLNHLHLAIMMYENDNPGSYPTPDNWCDLIKPYFGNDYETMFNCPAIKDNKFYYAMNPNCNPNSPPDMVLLFETNKSNLNLSGGSELATTFNHEENVCNVIFKDGTAKRIKNEEIDNLKWE